MPRPMTEQEQQQFLAEKRVAVLSLARGGERPPLSSPIWYAYEPGGDITFYTGTYTRKAALLQQSRVLTLTVQQEELPYKYVVVEGSVTSVDQPPSEAQLFTVSSRYLPEDAARQLSEREARSRGHELVLFTIQPERWYSLDFTDDMG
jgi:uncharacterized protein